jgi:hypothetical protein
LAIAVRLKVLEGNREDFHAPSSDSQNSLCRTIAPQKASFET